MTNPEPSLLDAARHGDHQAFERLIAPYRRELLVHCYRLLGSNEDAEDVLQETWLRAWRRLNTFAERAPLRAWLYKIATNTAFDARAGRRTRSLPTLSWPDADPTRPLSAPVTDPVWIEPFPTALVADIALGPDARYEALETVTLAFVAVLQLLPARQRAALLLRDGLGWSTGEVAALLDLSLPALNSLLQRARATMQAHGMDGVDRRPVAHTGHRETELLDRYLHAWQQADAQQLAALLREDATISMPPLREWYRGREALVAFFAGVLFAGDAHGRYRLMPTSANGSPAFAVYQMDASGIHRPASLQVLGIADGLIATIDSFMVTDPKTFARFGLPPSA
jgi:RNA polymerase sigma-70 factor (ECF subfamily)